MLELVLLQFIDKLHAVIYKMYLTVSREPIIDLMIECHHYKPTLTCMLTSSNTVNRANVLFVQWYVCPQQRKQSQIGFLKQLKAGWS